MNFARLCVFAFFAPLREIFMSATGDFTQRRKERKDAKETLSAMPTS
jgi:hypothetical protein